MKPRCFKILGSIALIIAIVIALYKIFTKFNGVQTSYTITFFIIGIILIGIYFFRVYIKKEKDTCIETKKKK